MNARIAWAGLVALLLLPMLGQGPDPATEAVRRLPRTLPTDPAPPLEQAGPSQETRFEGRTFAARVSTDGLRFESGAIRFSTRAVALEQGGALLEAGQGIVRGDGARVTIDRGPLTEEYLFEDRRVEQIFRVEQAVSTGALCVRLSVQTNLDGPVLEFPRSRPEWRETPLIDGGLAFCDRSGMKRLAYTGAVAIDANGRRIDLDPHYGSGEIRLEVPAAFMAEAAFPLVIDPWVQIGFSATGGGISGTGMAGKSSIAMDSAGRPAVAWLDVDPVNGDSEVYFRRWNGSDWEELGGSASGGGVSANAGNCLGGVSLTLDASGNPAVAWDDLSAGSSQIYFRRWNGSSWVGLGGSESGGGLSNIAGASNPSLDLESNGNPVVAFNAPGGGSQEIMLVRWNGASWVGLGGSEAGVGLSNTAGAFSLKPSLKLNASDQPVVAWREGPFGTEEIYLRAWNGAAWVELGGSGSGGGISATAGSSVDPSLALDSAGNPVVAWSELVASGYNSYEVSIRAWNPGGSSWVTYGGSATITLNSGNSGAIALSLDPSDLPVLAWQDNSDGIATTDQGLFQIWAARWTGTAWAGMEGSYTFGGLTQSVTQHVLPSLALDASGNPYVSWLGNSGGNIFVRAFTSQAPGLAGLGQLQLDGVTALAVGATSTEGAVVFSATITTLPTPDLRLEVEIAPVGTAFTGNPTAESPAVLGGSTARIILPLANGSYHWRARVKPAGGAPTSWVSFGGNAESAADVVVNFSSGTTIIDQSTTKKSCGLTGLEILGLLALARLRRRRS